MERLRVVPATWAALAILLVLGLVLAPAPATAADPKAGRGDRLLLDDAGWHGRPVQQPHAHTTVKTAATSLPGWAAGPVALGTGAARAGGSERVRELQRRLRRLGYATGPVDGIFGRRTRAALAWFQRKHGLPANGRASARAVGHLRERTGARAERPATPNKRDAPAQPPEPAQTTTPRVAPVARTADDEAPWGIAALALSAVGVALLSVGYAVERRRRRQLAASRPQPVAAAHQPPDPQPPAGRPRALGYVRLARGAPSASFHAQAAAIETGCLARGMTLVSLVSDPEPPRGSTGRPPALTFALERLAAGEVDRLVVSRLDHLAASAEELRRLVDSLAGPHAGIVVLDRDVDTTAIPEPAALDALLAPADRPRPPFVPRARRAIDAHIASMLEEGASREDAVAALNAEPVPPPQGGRWSPSGVDAALRRRGGAGTTEEERFDA
jgi:peptidoglycan hydrolase-like protein with peptidoglycan-binding domain